jgi:hypothetical protein
MSTVTVAAGRSIFVPGSVTSGEYGFFDNGVAGTTYQAGDTFDSTAAGIDDDVAQLTAAGFLVDPDAVTEVEFSTALGVNLVVPT